jgi:Tfp pilus assembly protein PilN
MIVSVDLIPSELHEERRARNHRRGWATVAVVTATLIGTIGAYATHQARDVTSLRVQADTIRAEGTSLRNETAVVEAQVQGSTHLLQQAERLREGHYWSRMLAYVADCVPDSVVLALLATDPPQPGTEPARGRDREAPRGSSASDPRSLALRGYALEHKDVNELIENLKKGGVFVSVSLLYSKREPYLESEGVSFTLTCHW